MRQKQQPGCVVRVKGWWTLRFRERVSEGGVLKTVNRAQRIAPVSPECKTKQAARKLATETLTPIVARRQHVEPLLNVLLGEFVEYTYLPHVEAYLRASTANSYKGMWRLYLKPRCSRMWLRDVQTHHVQRLLEAIATEHAVTRTTLGHIKHLLSGCFRHAAQQGFLDMGSNPVKLASIPAFAPRGKEGTAYSLDEIAAMLRLIDGVAATAIATAAYTGLRLGELRGLRWEDYSPAPDADPSPAGRRGDSGPGRGSGAGPRPSW